MNLWGSLLTLAAEQHGVVARAQAATLGIPPPTFDRRVRQEGWGPRGPGLWSPPGTPTTRWLALAAALLRAGPEALATGAAGLWAAGVGVTFPAPIRLVTPMRRHANRQMVSDDVKIIASRTLRPADASVQRRVAVAKPPRCFVDMVVPPTPSVAHVRDALITTVQARATTLEEVSARAELATGVPGRAVLMRAIEEVAATGADSPFSLRVHQRLLRDGLRPDPHPAAIETPGRTLHPDITFSCERVCIECDSMLAHSSQRDLATDHKKDRAYREVDWIVLRIGWWEFQHRWSGFLADLRRALARGPVPPRLP